MVVALDASSAEAAISLARAKGVSAMMVGLVKAGTGGVVLT